MQGLLTKSGAQSQHCSLVQCWNFFVQLGGGGRCKPAWWCFGIAEGNCDKEINAYIFKLIYTYIQLNVHVGKQ